MCPAPVTCTLLLSFPSHPVHAPQTETAPRTNHPVFPLNHRWQTQGPGAESSPPPCFICPAPCFYSAAALSSCSTVKEQLHLHSCEITFGPLKATARLVWPRGDNEFDTPAQNEKKSKNPLGWSQSKARNFHKEIKLQKQKAAAFASTQSSPHLTTKQAGPGKG